MLKIFAWSSAALALVLGILLAALWRRLAHLREAAEDQVRLQKAIENAAREWLLTFDAVDSPLLVVGVEGKVKRMNYAASRLAGRDYRELLGLGLGEISPEEPWASAAVLAEVVAESREPHACSAEEEAGGRTWDLSATLSTGPAPADDRIILVARDVTGIVELQRTLRRSELMSAMGSLVAGVAHEVRNPLFGISAVVDAFENRFGEREEYRRYLEVLKTQLVRLNALMGELLEYGKPPVLHLAPADLAEIVGEAVRNCASLADREEVKVEMTLDPILPRVSMDRDRVLQVLQNLLENALQHSPQEGTVRIETAMAYEGVERWAVCRVMDGGPGFRQEDLARVFEPFFTRRREGTGLGLSIVHRIIEQHGGQIHAGNLPDGGAVMEFRLPVPAAGRR